MKARLGKFARWATGFDVISTSWFIGLGCWLVSTLASLVGANLVALAYAWFALVAFGWTLVGQLAGLLVERVDDRRRSAEVARIRRQHLLDDLAEIRARTAARRAEVLGDEADEFAAELRAAKQVEP